MFYPLGRKSEKPYGAERGGGGDPTPPPLVRPRGLNDPRKKPALIIVGKTACQKEN